MFISKLPQQKYKKNIIYKLITNSNIMCITLFYLNSNKNNQIQFLIAFNRDEQPSRKTLPFSQFVDDPNIYGGVDVAFGGTWLGLNVKTGIFVFLTNYKLYRRRKAKSRGILVKKFLSTSYLPNLQNYTNAEEINNKIYKDMRQILKNPKQYSAFNITVYNMRGNKMFYMCSQNQMQTPLVLQNNKVHGLSNTQINKNWNKIVRGKKMFNSIMHNIQQHQNITNCSIFEQMEIIMKNCDGSGCLLKYFEPSIFIQPYYSPLLRTYRMTKSTFYAIFRTNQDGTINADIKEVTYHEQQNQTQVQLTLTI